MRLGISRSLLSCWAMLLLVHSSQSQDLFDYKNSKAFADYLYKTNRFDFAIKEYSRVIFLAPQDTTSWVNLVRSYQQIGDFSNSLSYLNTFEQSIDAKLPELGLLRSYTYLKTAKYGEIDNLVRQYSFQPKDEEFIRSSSEALAGNWSHFLGAPKSNSYWISAYSEMAQAVTDHKHKSPFLAGTFSAIIPGTGKMYAKRWKDGLFSLLLVGASSWQAGRLISKNGINNFGSIFFSGFAFGLYLGNIYGSGKAARDHNVMLQNEYHQKAHQLVDLYFDY